MSYPQNYPQIVGFAGTGVTTPNGSNIQVFDTPIQMFIPGQNDATVQADLASPPAASQGYLLSVPGSPNTTPPPPPATQPARCVHDGGQSTGSMASQPTHSAGATVLARGPLHNDAQGRQVSSATLRRFALSNNWHKAGMVSLSSVPPLTAGGAPGTRARSDGREVEASPINVSWDTTITSTGTVSPTVRAAETRNRLATSASARDGNARPEQPHTGRAAPVEATRTDAQAMDTSPSTPAVPPGLTLEARPAGESGAQPETTRMEQQRAQGTASRAQGNGDDYFSWFPTPPTFTDPPQSYAPNPRHQATQNFATELSHGANVRTSGDEHPPASLHQVSESNERKRLFAGTPDPEGEQRSAPRPRPAGSTPRMRFEGVLPDLAQTEVNVWSGELERSSDGALARESGAGFSPLASSTPVVARTPLPASSAPRLSQQQLRQHLSRAPGTPLSQRLRAPAYIGLDIPLLVSSGAARWRDGEERSNETRDGEPYADEERVDEECDAPTPAASNDMDIDEPAQEQHETTQAAGRGKGKGKARATSAELEDSDPEQDCEPPASENWDEEELAQARHESLQQARQGYPRGWLGQPRRGEAQTEGAGPSGSRDEREELRREAARSRTSRGTHTMRAREGLPSREQEWLARRDEPILGGRLADDVAARRNSGYSGPRSSYRAPSEFFPLPNTRAADYMADRRADWRDSGDASSTRPRHASQRSQHGFESYRSDFLMGPGVRDPANPAEQLGEASFGSRTGRAASTGEHDERISVDNDNDWDEEELLAWNHGEDGEILPSALRQDAPRDDATPTPIPDEGFPTIHHDDPETALRGMALDWLREVWGDEPNADVLVQPYNYRYSEDDALNRQVADALRWAFEQITGEVDFDVVPPELEDSNYRRQRNLPSIWAIRGLTPRGTAAAIARGTWSFDTISFMTAPRATPMQSWLFTLEGYLRGDAQKIQAAVMRVLMEDSMRAWIVDMISANPSFAGWPLGRAFDEVIGSLRVEVIQLGNGNYVANVHIRSPTRDIREWRRWVADLRSRRYRSFAIGTGRVRQIIQCSGCTSVAHPAHLCPFPRLRGWNGPAPGEGVFGERSGRAGRSGTMLSRATGGDDDGRPPRRDVRGNWPRQNTPRNGRNGRNERPERSERGARRDHSGRDDRNSRNDRNDRNDRRDWSGRGGSGGRGPSYRGGNGRGSGSGAARGGRRN